MTAKLYVGNVNYRLSGQDLCTLFSEVGMVLEVRIVLDRVTGKSRGFAFLEMSNSQEAAKAISRFNGHTLLGRKLLVHFAQNNKDHSQGFREIKQNYHQEVADGNVLAIGRAMSKRAS